MQGFYASSYKDMKQKTHKDVIEYRIKFGTDFKRETATVLVLFIGFGFILVILIQHIKKVENNRKSKKKQS